jgi:pimeloyl-ACP methyl ester carboxylesterase
VYLYDRLSNTRAVASVDSDGRPLVGLISRPTLAPDGRVAFAYTTRHESVFTSLWMFTPEAPFQPSDCPTTAVLNPPAPPPPPPPPPSPSPLSTERPVVLVPGLRESTASVTPDSYDCEGAGLFSRMCEHLRSLHLKVFVVSSSAGAKHGAVLDNRARIDGNAERLARYLHDAVASKFGGGPVLVGHSMGGVISHVAIARYSAPASGLFTIGTPHEGSFWADAVELALNIPCLRLDLRCWAIKHAAQAVLDTQGGPAILDMTSNSRRRDNASLRPLTLPVWVFAGTVISGVDPSGYYFPNDEQVGWSSALGAHAGLGTPTPYEDPLWHNPTTLLGLPHANNEFEDARILDRVADAALGKALRSALRVTSPYSSRVSPSTVAAAAASMPSARVVIPLRRQMTIRVSLNRSHTVARDTALFTSRPFSEVCGHAPSPAVTVSTNLYAMLPNTLPCERPTLRAPTAQSVVALIDDRGVRATVVPVGKRGTRVTVRADTRVDSAQVRLGSRVIRGRRDGRSIRITIPYRPRTNGTITARAAGSTFAGPFVPLAT